MVKRQLIHMHVRASELITSFYCNLLLLMKTYFTSLLNFFYLFEVYLIGCAKGI